MMDEINAKKQELFTLLDAEKEKKNLDQEKQEANKSQKLIGLSSLVLTVLTITASATSVQLLERTVPDFELNTFRTGTALLSVLTCCSLQERMAMDTEIRSGSCFTKFCAEFHQFCLLLHCSVCSSIDFC